MTITTHLFRKRERLCGEIRIAKLFAEGKAFISYPVRVVYLKVDKAKEPIQVMLSVPKKRFKRANKRNRLRRQMKEAYRLNKNALFETAANKDYSLHLALTYISDDEIAYAQIEKKMKEALQKIQNELA